MDPLSLRRFAGLEASRSHYEIGNVITAAVSSTLIMLDKKLRRSIIEPQSHYDPALAVRTISVFPNVHGVSSF